MKIAILSDIHCNVFALKNVLEFIESKHVDKYIFLGDYFGYYPWAKETYDLLMTVKEDSFFLIGNHDKLLIEPKPLNVPEYYHVIEDNKSQLSHDALFWLKQLPLHKEMEFDGIKISAFHGTPTDILNGRYYPDNNNSYDWFPKRNEVILLGHTHYPLANHIENGGLIINPGSIGQPRDGILSSSFCIFDTLEEKVNFFRVKFDVPLIVSKLEEVNWYPKAINSLKKK